MGALDEVKSMQKQGLGEDQIIQTLRDKNVSFKDISEALAQSKIKAAVEQPAEQYAPPMPPVPSPSRNEPQNLMPGMQQSIMPPQDSSAEQYAPQAPQYPEYSDQQQYSEYNYSQPGSISTDTIAEISEQIIASKMNDFRKQLEKSSDLRTQLDSKIETIDERLKRIEKVIDTLQSSVLRKVGDYVTNVEDLKNEIIQTQKTFAKVVSEKHAHSHSAHHPKEHHKK